MAPWTMTRDISTIFLVVLTISGTISGLPLAGIDGENNDGQQMFPADMPPPPPGAFNDDAGVEMLPPKRLPEPRSGYVAPPSDDGFDVDTPVEVAGVAGTGLAMMAGPVVPGSNTGDMFPDNMPPPPPGAFNDEAPQLAQVVPASNDNMFPDNMPPPPPGAFNDEAPQLAQVVPASNGNMFPDNMPPPPPGAVNDEVPQFEQVLTHLGQAVPASNGNMFPDNMPPPPPGAFNDEAAPLPEQVIEPQPSQMEVNQDDAAPPNQETASPYRGSMFPPNMPPPPPGAYNDPPPVSKSSVAKPLGPSLPSVGIAVEPVYVTGVEVPEAAVVPPGYQIPFIDPNQVSIVPSNQQAVATAEEPINIQPYNPENVVSNDQNTPYGQTIVNPQGFTPNTQEIPEAGQVPYNPYSLDASNNPIPNEDNQPAESVQNQDEAQASYNPNVPNAYPSPSAQLNLNPDLPADSAATNVEGQSYENVNKNPSESFSDSTYESSYESSYEDEQNNVNEDPQEWSPESADYFSEEEEEEEGSESKWEESESDSDYSFMEFLESVMDSSESSDYESPESEEDDNTSWQNSDSEADLSEDDSAYLEDDSDYLEDSSDYSDLEWIFNSNAGSSLGAGGESSEEKEDGGYFGGGDGTEEAGHREDEQEQTYPDAYIDALELEDDLYRTGGTKLIVYCIPALILTVLVLLAWKNYKGKIRVVPVPSVDAKQYDWKSDRKSEEHAPMLLDQDEREY